MQRAAASPPASPQTPDSQRSNKRQKLSNGHASPMTPSVDTAAIQAALAAEEVKHQAALDRQRAASQETKWVFSCAEDKRSDGQDDRLLAIVSIGYEEVDNIVRENSEASAAWRPAMVGRRSFGKFNRALEVSLGPSCIDRVNLAILTPLLVTETTESAWVLAISDR